MEARSADGAERHSTQSSNLLDQFREPPDRPNGTGNASFYRLFQPQLLHTVGDNATGSCCMGTEWQVVSVYGQSYQGIPRLPRDILITQIYIDKDTYMRRNMLMTVWA